MLQNLGALHIFLWIGLSFVWLYKLPVLSWHEAGVKTVYIATETEDGDVIRPFKHKFANQASVLG